jgi:hypothetical protein
LNFFLLRLPTSFKNRNREALKVPPSSTIQLPPFLTTTFAPCLSRTVSISDPLKRTNTYALIAAFPSSEAFDVINSALTADEKERKDAIKQGNAVFAFTLKNKAGETESWNIDLKNKGEVGKGLGDKPTGKCLCSENLCVVRALWIFLLAILAGPTSFT